MTSSALHQGKCRQQKMPFFAHFCLSDNPPSLSMSKEDMKRPVIGVEVHTGFPSTWIDSLVFKYLHIFSCWLAIFDGFTRAGGESSALQLSVVLDGL